MLCLICKGPATDITPGGFDGVMVDCRICKPYEIADRARDKFGKVAPEKRAEALQMAKRFASPGARSSITSICF